MSSKPGNTRATTRLETARLALVACAPDHLIALREPPDALPEATASTRVLRKCGFVHIGEVVDPEDGPVWRWERSAAHIETP